MPIAARSTPLTRFLMSMVLLTTWSAASSDALAMGKFPDIPVVLAQCPPLIDYDQATLTKSAQELRALLAKDPRAATPVLMRDYRSLRDECRAFVK